MIRLLTAGTRITLVVAAMAVSIPVITFAQTSESATESVPGEAEVAEDTASLTGDEDSTDKDTSVQTEQAGAVEAEIQRRINEPQDWLSNLESGSTIIRNVGLVIAAIIALWFAKKRIVVADRQADAAQRQQATAQRGLLNERYQKAAEMLGNKGLSVRLGGIYALARLAREHPGDYHTQIMRLLCAFVRNPSGKPVEAPLSTDGLTPAAEFISGQDKADDEDGVDRPLRVSEDVQAVMTAVGERREAHIAIEEEKEYRLDLIGAKLKFVRLMDAVLDNVNLIDADLTNAVLIGAKLKGAYLRGTNFENANLFRADLGGVRLSRVNLENANLLNANLTRAVVRRCGGLTQEQIDRAVAQQDHPPKLTGTVDANTGEPLVWRGGTPKG